MAKKYNSKESIPTYRALASEDKNISYYETLNVNNLNAIFGAPYQFMQDVDPRIIGNGDKNESGLGKIYSDRVFSHMPLLFLTPCKQKFMPEFTNDDRSRVIGALLEGKGDPSSLEGLDRNGRYYTTQFDAPTYYGYVNTMCREVACFLGLGDEKLGISDEPLKSIDWQSVRNKAFNSNLQCKNSVLFYLDGGATMDDSFSNSTTESALASTINSIADQTNELKFLLGESSAASALSELGSMISNGVNGALGSIFGGNTSELMGGMLADLSKNGIKTIVSGGKILFPKIWSNSEFDRSYNFNIKLRSPDHDSLSIYLNILVPYLHALAFVLPKQSQVSLNGYVSPFLLRAYCKGFFNIDCGIVTGLSVTRGAEAQWNDDGLPTQMDISMTIEDLYSGLSMTSMNDSYASENEPILSVVNDVLTSNARAVVKNTAMIDYLANLAGLNVADEELGRKVKLFTYLMSASIREGDQRIFNRLGEAASNWFYNTFYRTLN